MTVVLWHIEISHYNEKARWALDYKGIPYELRAPMPGTHRLAALRLTRGKHDRLPVLGIDGRRIGDSTAIIAALMVSKTVKGLRVLRGFESHPLRFIEPDSARCR